LREKKILSSIKSGMHPADKYAALLGLRIVGATLL
jgi:hypothetical protein